MKSFEPQCADFDDETNYCVISLQCSTPTATEQRYECRTQVPTLINLRQR